MSFPLIQNPAPLQQLAQTITAIRDRQMQMAEARRQRVLTELQLAAQGILPAEMYRGMNRSASTLPGMAPISRGGYVYDPTIPIQREQTARDIALRPGRASVTSLLQGDPTEFLAQNPTQVGSVLREQPNMIVQTNEGVTRVVHPRTGELVATYGAGPDGTVTDEQRRALNAIVTSFRQDSGPVSQTAVAYATAKSHLRHLLDNPRLPNESRAASNTAVAYGFARMMDPSGRQLSDQDLRTATATGILPAGFPLWVQQFFSRLARGEYAPEFLRSVEQAIDTAAREQEATYSSLRGVHMERATQQGLDPNRLVLPDDWERARELIPAAPTSAATVGGDAATVPTNSPAVPGLPPIRLDSTIRRPPAIWRR